MITYIRCWALELRLFWTRARTLFETIIIDSLIPSIVLVVFSRFWLSLQEAKCCAFWKPQKWTMRWRWSQIYQTILKTGHLRWGYIKTFMAGKRIRSPKVPQMWSEMYFHLTYCLFLFHRTARWYTIRCWKAHSASAVIWQRSTSSNAGLFFHWRRCSQKTTELWMAWKEPRRAAVSRYATD